MRPFLAMLKDTSAVVAKALKQGKTPEQMKQAKVLAAWQKWSGDFFMPGGPGDFSIEIPRCGVGWPQFDTPRRGTTAAGTMERRQVPARVASVTGKEICQVLTTLMSAGADLEKILSSAVEHLHRSNPRFHWTGIYELGPDNVLRLGPFIGAPTDHVVIAVGQGVCGTAVAEKRTIVVPDVSKASNYLACSTATRSELVVLIRRGDRMFAQIDIDSHELNAFDAGTVTQVESVADGLAEAYARALGP